MCLHSCPFVQSHQQHTSTLISPHPSQHLVWKSFRCLWFYKAHSPLVVGLSLISLMSNIVEHICMYLCTMEILSSVKWNFASFVSLWGFLINDFLKFFIHSRCILHQIHLPQMFHPRLRSVFFICEYCLLMNKRI